MSFMSVFRTASRASSSSWLHASAAVRRPSAAGLGGASPWTRRYSSGEHFTVYHDAKCAACKSVVEALISADAPYTTMSFLKKTPKEDALLQVARVLQGGAELMLLDNSWPRVTNPEEVRAHSTTLSSIHIVNTVLCLPTRCRLRMCAPTIRP